MAKITAEYVWVDAAGRTRSKSRVLRLDDESMFTLEKYPLWNFDGSSTEQATREKSDVVLKPVAVFKDPFKDDDQVKGVMILCDCYDAAMNPIATNTRYDAQQIFDNPTVRVQEPMFGIEQEYVLYDLETDRPVGWPDDYDDEPDPQGKYYCGVGAGRDFGSDIAHEHYERCLAAGVEICGINGEVMPGQWEFQIGPCIGVDCADHLIMARHLLAIVAGNYEMYVSYDPKPEEGDWNGSGCHTNFSSLDMRNDGGLKYIHQAIKKLSYKHKEHLAVYGDNSKRLTGHHETSSPDKFTFGVSDRGASVRIPVNVAQEGKGYFEDRRPASDCDPYLVTSMIAKTTLLE